jgi:alcohol dehydrogenase class IV
MESRENLGLAADLGGYAVMLGGTNGAHLTSFSLVDVLSHGRACAIMNPYYTVFFAPAIEKQLVQLADLLDQHGLIPAENKKSRGRDLGLSVARGLIAFQKAVSFPSRLSEVAGITPRHIERALQAAKNPQLEMKLKNMPVPLTAAEIETYMGPVLKAAYEGDFSLIQNY